MPADPLTDAFARRAGHCHGAAGEQVHRHVHGGGAAAVELMRRRLPALAEKTVVPVASGLIAGESLMGILIAFLGVTGVLAK